MKKVSIAVSKKRGTVKTVTDKALLIGSHGLEGDAHAGAWHRQVRFLSRESIDESRRSGLDVTFGDYADNIAAVGIDFKSLPAAGFSVCA